MTLDNISKNWLTNVTCIVSFTIGWALTIAGFCVPPIGEVADSILWILGQVLLYCGACVGISQHYNTELHKIKKQLGLK